MKLKGKQREELKQECIELLSIDREIFEIHDTFSTAENIYDEVRRCSGKNIKTDLERLKRASDLLVSVIYHIKEKEKIWNELPKATWWYCHVGYKPKPIEVAVLSDRQSTEMDYIAEGQTLAGAVVCLSSERAQIERSTPQLERYFVSEEIAIDWQKRSIEHQLTERPDRAKALEIKRAIDSWENTTKELGDKIKPKVPYIYGTVTGRNEYTAHFRGLEERPRRG